MSKKLIDRIIFWFTANTKQPIIETQTKCVSCKKVREHKDFSAYISNLTYRGYIPNFNECNECFILRVTETELNIEKEYLTNLLNYKPIWKCKYCNTSNDLENKNCFHCGSPRNLEVE